MIPIENLFSNKAISKEASTGNWNTYRALEGDPFAGTGTKAELVELERRMREIISTGLYPYMTMENQLVSHGYDQSKIRTLFTRLTGVRPEDFQDVNGYTNSPQEIPGLTVAWGLSKKKGAIAYFVQPWNLGFAIFCQTDDVTREIVDEVSERNEALTKLAKYVKEVVTYHKPMDMKLMKPDFRSLQEPLPIGTKTAAAKELLEQFKVLGGSMQQAEKVAAIKHAFASGQIPEEDYITLLKAAGFNLKSEETDKDYEAAKAAPVQVEETPSDLLDSVVEERPPQISAAMTEIEKFFVTLNGGLNDKRVGIKGLRYMRKDLPSSTANLPMKNQAVYDVFNNNGIISVVVECSDLTKPANTLPKYGVAVFSVVGEDLVMSGQFKGEDEQLYDLTSDGIENYLKSE